MTLCTGFGRRDLRLDDAIAQQLLTRTMHNFSDGTADIPPEIRPRHLPNVRRVVRTNWFGPESAIWRQVLFILPSGSLVPATKPLDYGTSGCFLRHRYVRNTSLAAIVSAHPSIPKLSLCKPLRSALLLYRFDPKVRDRGTGGHQIRFGYCTEQTN